MQGLTYLAPKSLDAVWSLNTLEDCEKVMLRSPNFSSNGGSQRSNMFTIDGTSMMNMMGTASASASGNSLGVDGIKEFKTVTSAMSAEYGGVEAAQIQMVSKNGTNQFHGDLFEYVRNSAMDARNHFDYTSQLGEERLPPFQRNQFGGLVSRVEDAPSFRRNTLGTVSFSNVQEFMTGIFSQESAGSGVFDRNYSWECPASAGNGESVRPLR